MCNVLKCHHTVAYNKCVFYYPIYWSFIHLYTYIDVLIIFYFITYLEKANFKQLPVWLQGWSTMSLFMLLTYFYVQMWLVNNVRGGLRYGFELFFFSLLWMYSVSWHVHRFTIFDLCNGSAICKPVKYYISILYLGKIQWKNMFLMKNKPSTDYILLLVFQYY